MNKLNDEELEKVTRIETKKFQIMVDLSLKIVVKVK